MRRTLAMVASAAACHSSSEPLELGSAKGVVFDIHALAPRSDYDPIALAAKSAGRISNPDANIPPLCYTRSDGIANPCWTCHTRSRFPNLADDWELQQNYSFPDSARVNHWRNLFRSRGKLVAKFTDEDLLAYVRIDNYTPLRVALSRANASVGWKPDLDFTRGFDDRGFANDGTGWRAIRYKPFPGTFWPTNGSADDVYIRLPVAFRRDARGDDVYAENLAILEAAIAGDPDSGALLADHYLGDASDVFVERGLYPAGTEFLHTVRYLDPTAPGFTARRMKEVRYMRKLEASRREQLVATYRALEAPAAPPPYTGDPVEGLRTPFGWQLQGWIEDARGWLRLQTYEEQAFCTGCHTGLGVTVDQTFAFPRKVPGAGGWRVQDVRGIPDAPELGHDRGEYVTYLSRARAGDELRANDEILARFFVDGLPDAESLACVKTDISQLVLPSRERALSLDRAYLANVIEQSYVWGRDAIEEPVRNVQTEIRERSTGIGEAGLTVQDGRLRLDWGHP